MSKITDWMKNNKANVAFAGLDLPAAVSGEHKLKGMLTLITNLALGTQIWNYQLGKLFSGMGSMVKGLITSTGSLNAAMKKLGDTQAAQKSFTALGVSASGARAEIQKLAKMSAAKGMDFRDVSEATQNLISLSRGAKGTASDMEELIDVSEATGASLQELASNVGEVSAAMRNGDAIDGAIDRLRAIGAISDSSATSLKNLQKAGAGAFSIDEGMNDAMRKNSSGGKGGVRQAAQDRESASTGLKEAIGKPWVEGDVETTKNYTEALKAITPALASISEFFAKIFARTGAWTSWLVKTIAAIPGLGIVLKGVTVLLTMFAAGVAVVANIKLAQWLIGSTSLFGRMAAGIKTASSTIFFFTGSARAATVAAYAMSAAINITRGALILLQAASVFLIGFAVIAQIFTALTGNTAALAKEMDDAARASKDFNDELMLQANNIETLADKHALLQKALKASTDAWREVQEQQAANDHEWGWVSKEGKAKLASKTAAAEAIDASASKIISAPVSEIVVKRHEAAKELSEEQTARELASSRATPEQRAALDMEESKRLAGLAKQGEAEIAAGRKTELDASSYEIEKGQIIAADAVAGGPKARAAEIAQAQSDVTYTQSNHWSTAADTKRMRDNAKARLEKALANKGPDTSKQDKKIAETYAKSDSLEKQGMGEQAQVQLDRDANPNATDAQRKAWTKRHDDAQIKIDRGKKLSGESLQNKAESVAKAEESRKGEIAGKYANLEADAQAELAASMAVGHAAFMQQSVAKMESIDREIAAYRELHKGVKETTDAYLKNRANAKAAEEVARQFAEWSNETKKQEIASAGALANDESVGIPRARKERAQEMSDLKAEYEEAYKRNNPEEIQAAQNKIDEATRRDRLSTVEETKQQLATGRDIQNRHAAATGDASIIQKNQAVSEFQDVFDSVLQATGDKGKAEALGRRAAQDSVNLQGIQMQQAANTSGAVSSLARIGGGGGVEAVDTQIDLMKQSRDIQNAISATLVRIELAKKGIKQ